MNLAGRLFLVGLVFLSGCSDDDGNSVQVKDPNARAGSGGGGAAGATGMAGNGGTSGNGGSGGGGGVPDAGMEDLCTPVFLDGGVVSGAGAADAGDAGAGDAGDSGTVIANGPVTFAADIYPILRASCVPCHETIMSGGHNVAAADVNEAYSFVAELKSDFVRRVNGGGMPPPPSCDGVPGDPGCISVAELNLIVRWAAQCFPP